MGGAVLEFVAALVAALLAEERGGLSEWDCSVRVFKARALEVLLQGCVLLRGYVLLRGLGCSVERCRSSG